MPSFRKQDDRSQAVRRVMRKVHDAILKAYTLRVTTDQFDQAKLAERLGVDKAIVSRRLSGASNMTERTLAETFWALGHDLVIDAIPFEERKQGNATVHPVVVEPKVYDLRTTVSVSKVSAITTVIEQPGVKVRAESSLAAADR